MTGDELDRAIEFLLQSQANSEARIGRLEAAQEETNQQIRGLTTAQGHTQQQLDHLIGVVAELAEGQRRNKDDIDALVKLVGGIIEGRNGGTSRAG